MMHEESKAKTKIRTDFSSEIIRELDDVRAHNIQESGGYCGSIFVFSEYIQFPFRLFIFVCQLLWLKCKSELSMFLL